VAQFIVPFQQWLKWGYGSENAPDNQGYIFYDPMSDSVTHTDGDARFMVLNANDVSKGVVFTERTPNTRATRSNQADGQPMPETGIKALPQEKLAIKLQGDSSVTLDTAYTTGIYPITRFMEGAGQ